MPGRRLLLFLPDIGRYAAVLGFGQQNPVPSRNVLILQVAIAGARFRGNGENMPNRPELRTFAGWMQACDLFCPDLADFTPCVQPAMDQKRMAVTECIARSELNEILTTSLVGFSPMLPGCRLTDRTGRPGILYDSLVGGFGRWRVPILLCPGLGYPEGG